MYIFLCTVIVTLPRLGQIYDDFDDSRTLQYTPILTCYMINFFWSIPHLFFHNAIALPELTFIFNCEYILYIQGSSIWFLFIKKDNIKVLEKRYERKLLEMWSWLEVEQGNTTQLIQKNEFINIQGYNKHFCFPFHLLVSLLSSSCFFLVKSKQFWNT